MAIVWLIVGCLDLIRITVIVSCCLDSSLVVVCRDLSYQEARPQDYGMRISTKEVPENVLYGFCESLQLGVPGRNNTQWRCIPKRQLMGERLPVIGNSSIFVADLNFAWPTAGDRSWLGPKGASEDYIQKEIAELLSSMLSFRRIVDEYYS